MQERKGEREGPLGLVAGAGDLPGLALVALRESGIESEVFTFENISDPALGHARHRTRLGELGRLAAKLEAVGVRRLLIVGKFEKTLLLMGNGLIAPDAEALALLGRVREWSDDGLQGAIGRWLEEREFSVVRQDHALASLIAQEGLLTKRAPTEAERADAEQGRAVVAELGRAGIGQSAALRSGCVVAVEAVEGTDAMIERAGRLVGPGATIVKAARPGQDRRFDLPAVGPRTIESLREAGATALAIEAGSTLVLDRAELVRRADAASLAVWAFEPSAPALDRSTATRSSAQTGSESH